MYACLRNLNLVRRTIGMTVRYIQVDITEIIKETHVRVIITMLAGQQSVKMTSLYAFLLFNDTTMQF